MIANPEHDVPDLVIFPLKSQNKILSNCLNIFLELVFFSFIFKVRPTFIYVFSLYY